MNESALAPAETGDANDVPWIETGGSFPEPAGPGLDEAHLWRASLLASDDRLKAFARTLSAEEQQRADSFHFETHRRRFVVAHGILRTLLGRYLDREPAALEFVRGPHGKPSLAGVANGRNLFFNASRSEDFALFAVTRTGEIGVDVERTRAIPEWPEIADSILSRDPDATPPSNLAEFFREWTRHEARVKACGLGLGGPPGGGRRWALRSLALEKDLFAAVALPAGVRHFRCWHWHDQLSRG